MSALMRYTHFSPAVIIFRSGVFSDCTSIGNSVYMTLCSHGETPLHKKHINNTEKDCLRRFSMIIIPDRPVFYFITIQTFKENSV